MGYLISRSPALFGRRCDYLVKALGDKLTVADAYLFTILGWANYSNLNMSQRPKLKEYADRIATRPAVVATLKAERLIK